MGLTAFGGPAAHVGYFQEEYVRRKRWISEARFAELMAVTQFLPGPGSSQLGAAIGFERGGWQGAIGAWLGFTLPSAVLLIVFALGLGSLNDFFGTGWISGLMIAVVAVVAHAVVGMRQKLCKDGPTLMMAMFSLIAIVFISREFPVTVLFIQPLVIVLSAVSAMIVYRNVSDKPSTLNNGRLKMRILRSIALIALTVIIGVGLYWFKDTRVIGGIYKAGALVFGGGHVVLPLLETEVVAPDLMGQDEFLAGYGGAQAVPGPLFTLAAYLGAKLSLFGNPWLGGGVALIAVFLPGMLLLTAAIPAWDTLKSRAWALSGIKGANAAVVGVLAAALAHISMSGSITHWWGWIGVVVVFFILKMKWLPVWAVIILCAALGGYAM